MKKLGGSFCIFSLIGLRECFCLKKKRGKQEREKRRNKNNDIDNDDDDDGDSTRTRTWQQRPSLAADYSDMSRGVRTYHAKKSEANTVIHEKDAKIMTGR